VKKCLWIYIWPIFLLAQPKAHALGAKFIDYSVDGKTQQELLLATNDEDSDEAKFIVVLNEKSDIQSFYKINDKGEKTLYDLENVSQGFVLERRKMHDVVVLSSDNFAPHNGATLKVTYLFDGRPGKTEYRFIELNLERLGDQWQISNEGKKVSELHFITKKVTMVGVVGISSVEVRYAP